MISEQIEIMYIANYMQKLRENINNQTLKKGNTSFR